MLVGGLVAEVFKIFLGDKDVMLVLSTTMIFVTLLYNVMNLLDGRRNN